MSRSSKFPLPPAPEVVPCGGTSSLPHRSLDIAWGNIDAFLVPKVPKNECAGVVLPTCLVTLNVVSGCHDPNDPAGLADADAVLLIL